jgi:hypothetical protein
MRKLLAIAFAGMLVPQLAQADKDTESDEEESTDTESDEEPDPVDDEEEGKGGGAKAAPKQGGDSKGEFVKQDLTGHDLAGSQKSNLFEKDRFFVDKVDSKKTAKQTLIQGSLTSTSFAYRESGGELANGDGTASASPFTRLFTDLRLQTDFRHIGGGKWDARADLRGRYTANPGQNSAGNYTPANDSSSQSGFLGDNELEIRELWLTRSGKRTDLTFGRQFVADLAGVKFDGLRFDYASSERFTLLGFGGLYPIRGSRSVTSDYRDRSPAITSHCSGCRIRRPASVPRRVGSPARVASVPRIARRTPTVRSAASRWCRWRRNRPASSGPRPATGAPAPSSISITSSCSTRSARTRSTRG